MRYRLVSSTEYNRAHCFGNISRECQRSSKRSGVLKGYITAGSIIDFGGDHVDIMNPVNIWMTKKLKPVAGFTVITLLSGGFGFLSLRSRTVCLHSLRCKKLRLVANFEQFHRIFCNESCKCCETHSFTESGVGNLLWASPPSSKNSSK